jgi:transposase-like protein
MSDAGVLVGRRSCAEIERLVALYGMSGMGRSEFCRSHGMALSTLNRHLKKQQNRQSPTGSNGVEQSRLVAVELAAVLTMASVDECPGVLTVLLSNHRRVEVGRGFDAATLAQLVTVLERV